MLICFTLLYGRAIIYLTLYKSFLRRFSRGKRQCLFVNKIKEKPPARVSPLLRLRRKIHLFLRFGKYKNVSPLHWRLKASPLKSTSFPEKSLAKTSNKGVSECVLYTKAFCAAFSRKSCRPAAIKGAAFKIHKPPKKA